MNCVTAVTLILPNKSIRISNNILDCWRWNIGVGDIPRQFVRQSGEARILFGVILITFHRICRYSSEQQDWLVDEHPDFEVSPAEKTSATITVRKKGCKNQ